jgi:hypothetical protein
MRRRARSSRLNSMDRSIRHNGVGDEKSLNKSSALKQFRTPYPFYHNCRRRGVVVPCARHVSLRPIIRLSNGARRLSRSSRATCLPCGSRPVASASRAAVVNRTARERVPRGMRALAARSRRRRGSFGSCRPAAAHHDREASIANGLGVPAGRVWRTRGLSARALEHSVVQRGVSGRRYAGLAGVADVAVGQRQTHELGRDNAIARQLKPGLTGSLGLRR